MDTDAGRLAELRAFLVEHRARLTPHDVDLPETGRRRVAGLRREEVAELAGVSSDWYRWFESGRPIRVSPSFLARLANALRLDTENRRTLYRLAVPELYEVELRVSPDKLVSQTSPVRPGDDIEDVLRQVSHAHEAFFSHDGHHVLGIRSRIVQSWERSLQLGADPLIAVAPSAVDSADGLSERRDMKHELLEAAAPVLAQLNVLLEDSGFALVIADERSCILDMYGHRDILRMLSRINFEPGTDLSEAGCGTNAVGTSIFDERPLQLIGAENFCEAGADLTCTGAPIRNPQTRAITGAIDVTGHCRRIYPGMISVISQAALEIEERLAMTRGGAKQ
jgi:transcriptional regulator with XRE-family HTH domain